MMSAGEIITHLLAEGFLAQDGDLISIGPRAEQKFGPRHFMALLSAFTAPPELKVMAGQRLIGTVDPISLMTNDGAETGQKILLSGRSWLVETVECDKRLLRVRDQLHKGRSQWASDPVAESFEVMQAKREILLGAHPRVQLSGRARAHLPITRTLASEKVDAAGVVIAPGQQNQTVWTWAGVKANLTLVAGLGLSEARSDNEAIRLPAGVTWQDIQAAESSLQCALPKVPSQMVSGLKFAVALPPLLAEKTIAERLVDRDGARKICSNQPRTKPTTVADEVADL